MRGDVLDIVLVVVAVGFGVSGYRRGFLAGALSMGGFVVGALVGLYAGPAVARHVTHGSGQALVGIAVVIGLATVGEVAGALLGNALRRRLTWSPARTVDSVGGAVVSGLSVLIFAWLIGTAVANSHFVGLSRQVRRSQVLGVLDAVMPEGRTLFSRFFRLLDDRGFPQVFNGLSPERGAPVAAPDPKVAHSTAVVRARDRILKITGDARSCSRRLEGTGFVFAPKHVMTNAHVVAGVRHPVVNRENGDRLDATVVLYDPDRDIAVLYVPDLAVSALAFGPVAAPKSDAVVAGYPENGPFLAVAARVRERISAQGPDIYQRRTVTRDVYALRTKVRPGNSGGPLLAPDGRVYGVIFAAAASDPDTGYALTAAEVAADSAQGRGRTESVSTQGCD
jgi:S1-C subfamily serine protease